MTQQISTKQAITNAIDIKKALLLEIRTAGTIKGQTGRIIARVSDHPVEIIHLTNYCNGLDKKYNSNTALELQIELEVRHADK